MEGLIFIERLIVSKTGLELSLVRDFSSGIGMTPFYRSVPSQIILSDGGADGSSIEGHPWPAYQRINSQGVRTSQQAGTGQDRGTDYLTVDQMRQFLRKLSKQKNSFAAGREIKWSV